MDGKSFQVWLAGVELLSDRQKAEALELLNGRDASAASLAAVELAVGDDRKCPHCGTGGAVANGKARRMQRYLCRSCGRTFGALTGTRLSGLHHKDRWLTFGDCLAQGDTVKTSAKRCGIAVSTAFRWRHRFLEAIRTDEARLHGIVEADETFVLVSDGCTSYRRCAADLGISHEVLNQSAGERVRGELHRQTVNNRHSRFKDFLRPRRGVATRYLASYLRWFHMIGLHPHPTPRSCLAAAIAV